MSDLQTPMKFGVFLAPYHKVGLNPTIAFERDIELAEHLDSLGFDEIWYGEHHSSGVEVGASPELMIAAAAQRTQNIKLGTGVSSLPYHNPFILADRIVQLSHIARGRLLFGVGPGQLLKDAQMLGIDPSTQRPRMEEALKVILRLFDGETVTETTDWYDLHEAVLQVRPYSKIPIAVANAFSPAGAKIAGRYGASMLSLGAGDPEGIKLLAGHWNTVVEEAALKGYVPCRNDWRLMGRMYVAETLEQAKKEVEHGLPFMLDYLAHVTPGSIGDYSSVSELVDALNASGRGVVGTPDMAVDFLEKLRAASGGFGTFLIQAADYSAWPALRRSYELFAEEVIPRLNGQIEPLVKSYDEVISTGDLGAKTAERVQAEARAAYEAERQARAQ